MALFVASHETYVAAGAVVAWHDRPDGMRSRECLRERKVMASDFYRRRGISDDFAFCPQTPYSRKMFHAMQSQALDKSRIFWTWHPDNFRGYFKSKIVFLSFPDQQTVEKRLWRARVGCRLCSYYEINIRHLIYRLTSSWCRYFLGALQENAGECRG